MAPLPFPKLYQASSSSYVIETPSTRLLTPSLHDSHSPLWVSSRLLTSSRAIDRADKRPSPCELFILYSRFSGSVSLPLVSHHRTIGVSGQPYTSRVTHRVKRLQLLIEPQYITFMVVELIAGTSSIPTLLQSTRARTGDDTLAAGSFLLYLHHRRPHFQPS